MGNKEGRQIFVDALTRFAEQSRNPRLTPIIRRVSAPLRVAVRGRDGVGRATVAAALSAVGVAITSDESAADVDVLVIAEALKPEDRSLVAAPHRPTVMVLNKADLTGFGAGGPLALAHRRAAEYRALTGLPTVPMVGLLAAADVDDELIGALRILVTEPADMTSTDAFVECEHPLPSEVRRRLLDTLDRFGIAHAVLAIGSGADAGRLTALLRRLSLVDRVAEHIDAAGAPVRYRRMRSVIAELYALAAQSGDDLLPDFLSTDDTVLAMMTAAVDVVEAAGVRVDRGDDPRAHLRRAVQWRRYGRGPVDALHRSCAADICRGSLRLLGRSG
ncbi:MAG TPA: hypothetical protein VHI10_16155 [Mycobacterium sp.]|nr:hypothetical protein [Mycobacterium sp.]